VDGRDKPGHDEKKIRRVRAAFESNARHPEHNPGTRADLGRRAGMILRSGISKRALAKRQSRCPNSDIEILKSTMGASHYRTG
jgi:hypothetical protein